MYSICLAVSFKAEVVIHSAKLGQFALFQTKLGAVTG